MNPHLAQLQPYPFEKLRALFAGVTPNPRYKEIKLSIGEPQHPTPPFIMEALANGLKGLANYPTTQGIPALRQAIAAWCQRRYGLELNPETEILPVNGSREALFSFAQTVSIRAAAMCRWSSARTRSTRSTKAPPTWPAPNRAS